MRWCRMRDPRRVLLALPVAALLAAGATVVTVAPAGAQLTGVTFSSVVSGNTDGCGQAGTTSLYCWGDDTYNELLDGGADSDPLEPNLLNLSTTLGTNTITAYATGNKTTCILTSAGGLFCWGYNGQGQVGDDTNTNATSPEAVKFNGTPTGTFDQLVGGGDKTFCALTSASQIWCWGGNQNGQLGDDTSANANEGNQVVTSTGLSGKTITQLAGWSDTFCALASTGEAYCWGAGYDWNLGNDSEANSNVPVPVDTAVLPEGVTIAQIAPSTTHTCFIDSQDNVWCWGSNIDGVNGLGDPDGSIDPGGNSWFAVPQKVTGLDGLGVTAITSSDVNSCAITDAASNNLYCWGGQPVGDGNQNGIVISPEHITAGDIAGKELTTVSAADYSVCAVDTVGSVFCWGDNSYGQIGDGTTYQSVSSEIVSTSPSETSSQTVPNTPVDVQFLAYATEVDLTWLPPYDDGGSDISSYTGSATDTGTDLTTTCAGAQTDGLWGCDITGLTTGDTYVVQVTATNSTGTSVPNSVGDVTLPAVPDAPTLDSVSVTATSITATWTPGASDNGQPIEAFTVAATTATTSDECSAGATATSCSITSFSHPIEVGSTFSVTVEATNDNGNSPPSNEITAILGNPPDGPQSPSAVVSSHQIAVSWSPPVDDGGTPITGYLAKATHGSSSATCQVGDLATGCTITGLTNGDTYAVTVVAQNEAGNSTPVSVGSYEPIGPPPAPTLLTATPSAGQIAATWSAPPTDGGSSLTGYTATANDGNAPESCTAGGSATGCTITGLVNGEHYTVTVTASNTYGAGSVSNSLTATPGTLPTAPSFAAVTPSTGSVALTWNAPTSNGGEAITRYVVTSVPPSAGCSTVAFTCTVTKLVPQTKYTFFVVAVNAVGDSPRATSAAVYPFRPKFFQESIASTVEASGVAFSVVVGDMPKGSVATFTMSYAGQIKCAASIYLQCGITERQSHPGPYKITVTDGKLSYVVWYTVPLLSAPAGVKLGAVGIIKIGYCPASAPVTFTVGGKNYTTKATPGGIASVGIKFTKKGTFTVTATVKGTVITPMPKIKVT